MDLSTLNPQQLAAVEHGDGPALVLAGAGSGKTRVLTTRAAWLLATGQARSENIVLVTFTNKAAQEMKHRIQSLTDQLIPMAGTFHSLCARILRRHAHLLGFDPNFTIYDADDQLQLIKNLISQIPPSVKLSPQAAKAMIEKAKNAMLTPEQYLAVAHSVYQEEGAKIYRRYQKVLKQNSAMDFDDLLLMTIELFHQHPSVRDKYQTLCQHVLVDEFQDTNAAQYELVKILAAPQQNLFCVGDFAQSIYSWRGANFGNLRKLENDFANIQVYRLEQNYRSTQNILDAAKGVISQNTSHPILDLFTDQAHSLPLEYKLLSDGEAEAYHVAACILKEKTNYLLKHMAILYRTNAQSRLLEEALIAQHVPYTIIGGTKFYDRKEIKDLLAYLKLIANPKDTISRHRAELIGKRRLAAFDNWLTQNSDLLQKPPLELMTDILKLTDYLDRYNENEDEDVSRLENIAELKRVAGQFTNLTAFLENVALIQDGYLRDIESGETKGVRLMSLHSAKGLEFDVVFMVGMEEGLLPHSRSLLDPDELEEERRLCYVGLTRAKHKLYLTAATHRMGWGSFGSSTVSRFIADIPGHLFSQQSTPLHKPDQLLTKLTNNPSGRFLTDLEDDQLDQFLKGEITSSELLDS